jgi:HEAT repeat protein
MRPKVVIVIVLCAFGLMATIALLKGVAGKNSANPDQPALTEGNAAPLPAASNAEHPRLPASGTPAPASDAVRAALIEKEIDQIHDLQGQSDETNNPVIIQTLVQKLSNPEPEVRKAALDVLRQLNDTNAIPALQNAVASLTDPREKVAILDTIEYLKLPPIFPTPTDTSTTNPAPNK